MKLMPLHILSKLIELGEKGLPKDEVNARNFRAKLLGLMYEDLLDIWLRKQMGYKVVGRDVRKGSYEGRRAAVDFILEKDGRLYAVEAKCWPAYLEGRLKKLALNNIEQVRRRFKTPFLKEDFVEKYRLEGKRIDGKILVWWDVEETEAERIKKELKLDELISLKKVLSELKGEADDIVEKYKNWANQLFNTLLKIHS